MTIVSHDTNLMRDWSSNVEERANDYDTLVNRLYTLVDQFVGSSDFKGGLSADFENAVVSQKPQFMKYSETFRECVELINQTATNIDNDEAELQSNINSANPLG